jgi:hypothetical protein
MELPLLVSWTQSASNEQIKINFYRPIKINSFYWVSSPRDILMRLERRLGGTGSPIIYLFSRSAIVNQFSPGNALANDMSILNNIFVKYGVKVNSVPINSFSLSCQNSSGTNKALITYVLV